MSRSMEVKNAKTADNGLKLKTEVGRGRETGRKVAQRDRERRNDPCKCCRRDGPLPLSIPL